MRITCLDYLFLFLFQSFQSFYSIKADQPILLWTQKSHAWSKIRGLIGDPKVWVPDMKKRQYIASDTKRDTYRYALDYDPHKYTIIWSDRKEKKIYRQPFNKTMKMRTFDGVEEIYSDSKSEVNGLAIDWNAGNIYWTDGAYRYIAVAHAHSKNGVISRILFSVGVDKPTGIAVNTKAGRMYWADQGPKPRIECSTLSGRDRRTFVTGDMMTPLGVTVDEQDGRVYWVDAAKKTVESILFDGSGRKSVVQRSNTAFFSVATSQHYLFVSDTKELTIHIFDKQGKLERSQEVDAVPHDVILLRKPSKGNNLCETKGCEHLCVSDSENTAECMCKQGFYLQLDGKSCAESKPRYIYSLGRSVWSADVSIPQSYPHKIRLSEKTVIINRSKVQAIGFHFYKDQVYLSDTQDDVILMGKPEGGDFSELTVNTRQVEGISVDWVTDTVYWADESLGHIMASKMDGRYHRIVLANIGKPKGLAVDAVNRYMYWTNGDTPKRIEKAKLDGSEMKTFVDKKLGLPQGLVVDTRANRLFWADAQFKQIESIALDGTKRRTVMNSTGSRLYDVTMFEDYATYTADKKSISFSLERTGQKLTDLTYANNAEMQQIKAAGSSPDAYDVVTYDVYLQPKIKGTCAKDNAGCHHHCMQTPEGPKCACAIGYKLNQDGKTCKSDLVNEHFLLFVDPYHKQIYQRGNVQNATQGVPVPNMDFPISVDYDSARGVFFWIDRKAGVIKSSNSAGTKEHILRKFTSNSKIPSQNSKPERLVVDPLTAFVFYVDSTQGAIFRMNQNGGDHQKIVDNLENPLALAVDSKNGKLFWSDRGTSPKIVQAKLDGKEQEVLINTGLKSPSGLSIDVKGQMLYFADESLGRIGSFNLVNKTRNIIFQKKNARPYGLAANSKFVYYSDWNEKTIYRVDLSAENGNVTAATPVVEPVFARIMDIKAMEETVVLPPTIIPVILGATVGGLLFLIILAILLAALAALARRRKRQAKTPDVEGGVDNPAMADTSGEYANFYNGTIVDPGNGMLNGHGPETNGDVPSNRNSIRFSGVPADALDSPRATENGIVVHDNYRFSDISFGSLYDEMGTAAAVANLANTGKEPIPIMSVPAVYQPTALSSGVKLNRTNSMESVKPPEVVLAPVGAGSYKKKDDNDETFVLANSNVATVIHRLAKRLRNRLSSIRWSGHEPDAVADGTGGGEGDPNSPAGDNDGSKKKSRFTKRTLKNLTGRKMKGKSRPPIDTSADDGEVQPAQGYGPEHKKGGPSKRNIEIPLQTHKPPRGFAPASHAVPVGIVRQSWGRAKHKKMTGS